MELGAMRAWAAGETNTLQGYAAFAYGGDPLGRVVNAACTYTTTVEIDTGHVRAGSPEAFGIYLGALGDHWSHRDCIAQLTAAGVPWGTAINDPRFPACAVNAHLREFGPSTPDTERTRQGILALYAALVERSYTHAQDTLYYPIPVDARDGYLARAIDEFVHTWPAHDETGQNDYPMQRRQKAAEIRQWCAATRASDTTYARVRWFGFLPTIIRGLRLRQ